MKQIVFESTWQAWFAPHQLCEFDDFFNFSGGRIINQNSKRNVTVMEFPENGRTRTFFMKRFIRPHYKDMLSAMVRFGKCCSQAEVEWRNARILLDHGIETYHPVCWGVRSRMGMEQESFFVTEEIHGQCLTDYLQQSWKDFNDEQKNQMAAELGKLFQRIHAADIRLPDSYLWHIYRVETGTPGVHTLGMIDLHRMCRTGRLHLAAKDLGAFFFSLPDGFMDERLRSLFLDSYLDGGQIRKPDHFRHSIRQWEQKIAGRRVREVERIG